MGNVRIRLGRRTEHVIEVQQPLAARPRRPDILYVVLGFVALILVGTILLMLPFATEERASAGLLRALFTSTSAVCVTGLVVVDTRDYWSTYGELVILLLIQLGGLGFMTSSTLLLLFFGRRLSLAQRVMTDQTTFRLGAETPTALVRRIVAMTLLVEAIGALLLVTFFSVRDGLGRDTLWRGFFTAISAFNNAGFDIEGGYASLTLMQGHSEVLLTVAGLTLLGGLGYAVVWDVMRHGGWRGLMLNSKIVLLTYAILTFGGTVVVFVSQAIRGAQLADLSVPQALAASFAQSSYARTSGFSALDMSMVQPELLMVIAGLMFIGGASGSTAGGIKVTTFSSLYFAIMASLRGDDHVHVFGREIPWRQINRALAVALLSVAIVFASGFALHLTTDATTDFVLFEAFSAFGTVGLSAGVTPTLNVPGQLIVIVTMFVGRLGPLTVGLALAARFRGSQRIRYPESHLSIG